MPYAAITYVKKNHVARITLNRPEAGNAINLQLAQDMADACCQINQDSDVYVVVVTGAGDAFCSGSELERMLHSGRTAETTTAELKDVSPAYGAATAIASIDRPVIATINGDALGQGLELALSCDIRIASNKARFGLPQVASGLIPMDGGTQRLPRIVGRSKALELILTAKIISAEEALDIGLVNKVVSDEKLASEVEDLAQTIASNAPIALRYAKEAINKGMDLTLEQGLLLEADLYAIVSTTGDKAEGVTAYLQKRPSQFKNQ